MNKIVLLLAVMLPIALAGTAMAQQDSDGNGLYEVCVRTSGEQEGQINFEFAEVSAEDMATSNVTHVAYYYPNADGTCPATPEEGMRIPREAFPPVTAPDSSDAQPAASEDDVSPAPTAAVDQSNPDQVDETPTDTPPTATAVPVDELTTVSLCVFRVVDDSTGEQIGQFETIQSTETAQDAVLADFPFGFVLGGGDADCPTEGLYVLEGGTYFPYTPVNDNDLVTICRWVVTGPAPGHWAENRVPGHVVNTLLEDTALYAELGAEGECPTPPPIADSDEGRPRPTSTIRNLPNTGTGVAYSTTLPLLIALAGLICGGSAFYTQRRLA